MPRPCNMIVRPPVELRRGRAESARPAYRMPPECDVTARQEERPRWTIQEAERLMLSLKGVLSARMVARPGGEIDEIHLLTTDDVKPKQTVRNVESALLSYFDLAVDHRKISVAQTDVRRPVAALPELPLQIVPDPEPTASDGRLLFYDHHMETERSNQLRHRVEVEWSGERFMGEAVGADVPRAKLETVCAATLQALESAAASTAGDGRRAITLSLDGVKLVDAFDRAFVLVAVHAISGRHITALSGAIPIT